VPGDRFAAIPAEQRAAVDLWLPPPLEPIAAHAHTVPATNSADTDDAAGGGATLVQTLPTRSAWAGGAIEFDRTAGYTTTRP
jgi:hypothetical protein